MSAWGDIGPGGPDGPGDEPWARTSDRNVWRAYKGGLVLTVTRVADGSGWTATVESPNVTQQVKDLQEQAALALDRAQQDLGQGRRDLETARAALAAACAMGTRQPCDGCHGAKAAAIAEAEAAIAGAEARIAGAERRIGICEAAADILGPLAERLARALARLRTVPQDLGEVYELIYEFVCSGGKLPRYGRWIEGVRT